MDGENAPNPVDKPALEAETAPSAQKSPGQELLDRFMAQAKLVDQLATELQAVRVHIDAPKAMIIERLPPVEPIPAARPQVTSYFAGMGSIADFNDKAIARLTTQVAELKALF